MANVGLLGSKKSYYRLLDWRYAIIKVEQNKSWDLVQRKRVDTVAAELQTVEPLWRRWPWWRKPNEPEPPMTNSDADLFDELFGRPRRTG